MKPLLSDKQYSIETAISSGPYKRPTGVLAASARIARQVLLSVAERTLYSVAVLASA